MYMTFFDWAVLGGFLALVLGVVMYAQRYVVGVSGFLAGSRMAGRYLLTVAGDMGVMGAISIIAIWEAGYHAGWGANWWKVIMSPFFLVMVLSGWVIYRYRQTRSLTMAEFLEKRYSRRFRIMAGFLAFFSGTLNYAIFPSVGARFLIYVCGIPEHAIHLGPLTISLSYAIVMALLLGTALWITLRGGQIGIMLSDGVQGIIMLILVFSITIFLMKTVSWGQIGEALKSAPNPDTASMVNPFKTGRVRDFNIWFYLIAIFGAFYGKLAWQGNSGYNAAAKTPHEARMAGILGVLRANVQLLVVGFFAMCAYTFMHHPDFAALAGVAQSRISDIVNPAIQKQMTVPIAMGTALPAGLLGCFVTLIVAMAVTTDDTYLHSWGSIFIQDVIMPFRKKKLSPEAHLKALRWSIAGVALFAYIFSLFFRHTGYILMFFAVTGAIFVAGAGACIIGGLYWKRGTTGGAWAALLAGAVLSVSSVLMQQQSFADVPVTVYAPHAVSVTVNKESAVQTGDQWTYKMPVWREEEWQAAKIEAVLSDGQSVNGTVYLSYGQSAPLVSAPDSEWPTGMHGIKVLPGSGALIPVPDAPLARVYYRLRCFTGQQLMFFCILISILLYVTISLLGRKVCNLDKLLHRGKYQTDDVKDRVPVRGWRALLGVTSEFTPGDKRIYFGIMIWTYGWVVINMSLIVINLISMRSDGFWVRYFQYQMYIFLVVGAMTSTWFGVGAVKNSLELFRGLKALSRDTSDDGWVEDK